MAINLGLMVVVVVISGIKDRYYYFPLVMIKTESELIFDDKSQGRTLFGSAYPSWSVCPVSGCCIYGVLSPGGQFTGDDIAWVYPDSRTVLLGERKPGVTVF